MSINSLTNLTNSIPLFDKIVEFEKRYTQTYLYLKFLNTPQENGYYWLEKILNQDSKFPLLKFSNETWDNLQIGIDSETEIECIWPESGLFNHNGDVYNFTRFPQRQWKRGICTHNCYIISANNNLLYDYDSVAKLNTNILNSTLLPQPILSLSTAIGYHKNNPEATGITLTKEFALLKSPFLLEHENYLLVRKNNPCAIVYPATQTIEIKFEYLKQEILDLLKNEPYKWIIKP